MAVEHMPIVERSSHLSRTISTYASIDRRRGRPFDERSEVSDSPDRLKFLAIPELLSERDDVDGDG